MSVNVYLPIFKQSPHLICYYLYYYLITVSPITAWEKLQQNSQGENFQQIYNDHFPIEVRQLLSPWFETKAWYVKIVFFT